MSDSSKEKPTLSQLSFLCLQLMLINPNGILFGQQARIDAANLKCAITCSLIGGLIFA